MTRNKSPLRFLLSIPSMVWLVLFFLVPTLIVVAFAFKPSDIYGGVSEGWTLETLSNLTNPYYLLLTWRSFWMSLLATILVLVISIPVGYGIARAKNSLRQLLLILIVVPFWSSFLIRIFAWKSLLHPEGFLKQVLVFLHIVSPETTLLYNKAAVIFIMVYAYLPFGILPIYASSVKFEWQMLEAAVDLGCNTYQAFFKVYLPAIRRGITTAFIMVFIPAMGAYVIPDLVGGPSSEMISNKIVQKTLINRNLPEASILSLMLGFVTLLPMVVVSLVQKRGFDFRQARRNIE